MNRPDIKKLKEQVSNDTLDYNYFNNKELLRLIEYIEYLEDIAEDEISKTMMPN